MIFATQPHDFKPIYTVVSCFYIYKDTILLLHRASHKPEGNTWGTVAGKMHSLDRLPIDAIQREMYEETGLHIESNMIHFDKTVFVRYAYKDFIYHIFDTTFSQKPPIHIHTDEHIKYQWVYPQEALLLPLVPDMDIVIKDFFNIG